MAATPATHACGMTGGVHAISGRAAQAVTLAAAAMALSDEPGRRLADPFASRTAGAEVHEFNRKDRDAEGFLSA